MTFLTKIANVKNANEKLDECSKFCERAIKIAKENVVNYELMEKGPDSTENVWLQFMFQNLLQFLLEFTHTRKKL